MQEAAASVSSFTLGSSGSKAAFEILIPLRKLSKARIYCSGSNFYPSMKSLIDSFMHFLMISISFQSLSRYSYSSLKLVVLLR